MPSTTQETPQEVAKGQKAVTITLPNATYEYYEKQAIADDRSLAKFLARRLQKQFEQESVGGISSGGLAEVARESIFRG